MIGARKTIPALARAAIRHVLSIDTGELDRIRAKAELQCGSRGVFVTLRTGDGSLRGCMGRVEPCRNSLAEEIIECAVMAATKDPRFPPVREEEVDSLEIEVSLLGKLEPVDSLEELDPERFGIMVRSNAKRGLLLPGLAGISTVERQLQIAREKGGIASDRKIRIFRFVVDKFGEADGKSQGK